MYGVQPYPKEPPPPLPPLDPPPLLVRGRAGIAGVVKVNALVFVPFTETTEVLAVYLVFGFNPPNVTDVESGVRVPLYVLAFDVPALIETT